MTNRLSTIFFAALNVLYAGTAIQGQSAGPDTWTQWRGSHRDGQIVGAMWPADLSERHLAEKWAVPLGPSYSGPIVSQDRVFVTETRDKKFEVVRALDRATGKQVWETKWEGAMSVPFFASSNGSWIRATPALDGDRLYVSGMRDVIVCLDTGTGEILWKRDFVTDTGSPLPQFGFASSSLVHGEHIYVQAGASFTKLEKLTGKIVWQTLKDKGGMNDSAFSSPVFTIIAGVPQFVVQTRTNLAGVSPDDGAVLWSHAINAFRGMNILTPTIIGDTIFTSSYGDRSTLLRLSREDHLWKVTEAWTHKSQGYMSSPIVINGHIYLHLRNQRLVCLDASTGVERWTTTPFGKYWSMVANGDKLLALDASGELLLIQSSPNEFRLIDRRSVADNSWAHVAVVNNQVFVRALDEMKVFTWQ